MFDWIWDRGLVKEKKESNGTSKFVLKQVGQLEENSEGTRLGE